ncbi:aromatic ring-hydroxylating dioxygenase subunit alpha [Pseudonocardia kongjuensis]|uniref:Aromatic ring-hydroxylating dioxygenase subunit alpha n=2 Tax=Pseudonocardia kongjuensis TaxID=102227 RepID=A0ABP4IBW4_9PSEU
MMRINEAESVHDTLANLPKLLDEGLSDRRIYSDPEIYRMEQRRIFARSWLVVAHESQIPAPGDFMESFMGEESVIVSRNRDGEVRVMLNSCRHRGNKVCRTETGNATSFMCPYHGWTYDSNGDFVTAPRFDAVYKDSVDRSRWGLLRARVESYKGLIFATFDADQVPLTDYLGDFTLVLDLFLDRYPGGVQAEPGVVRWTMNSNWKFGAENFGGDNYHALTTHFSAQDVGHRPDGGGRPAKRKAVPDGFTMVSDERGHSLNATLRVPGAEPDRGDPVSRFHADHLDLAIEHMGRYRAQEITRGNANLFPNASFSLRSRQIHLWHPRGPEETEIWLITFSDTIMPEDLRREARIAASHHFGPAGMFEQDDGENWEQSTLSCNGVVASSLPLNYQIGRGYEQVVSGEGLPDRLDGIYTEYGQLAMLRRWSALMLEP